MQSADSIFIPASSVWGGGSLNTRVSTKQSILLRNSCMILQEMTFLHEFPHNFRINTKPVLHEIAHSFVINKLFCTKFCMNTKFKSEFFHDIQIIFASNFALPMNMKIEIEIFVQFVLCMKTKLSTVCIVHAIYCINMKDFNICRVWCKISFRKKQLPSNPAIGVRGGASPPAGPPYSWPL